MRVCIDTRTIARTHTHTHLGVGRKYMGNEVYIIVEMYDNIHCSLYMMEYFIYIYIYLVILNEEKSEGVVCIINKLLVTKSHIVTRHIIIILVIS